MIWLQITNWAIHGHDTDNFYAISYIHKKICYEFVFILYVSLLLSQHTSLAKI